MGRVYFISRLLVGRARDDLAPARGAGIASLLGLVIWAAAFAVWNWVV
jgi:hypothetical protein